MHHLPPAVPQTSATSIPLKLSTGTDSPLPLERRCTWDACLHWRTCSRLKMLGVRARCGAPSLPLAAALCLLLMACQMPKEVHGMVDCSALANKVDVPSTPDLDLANYKDANTLYSLGAVTYNIGSTIDVSGGGTICYTGNPTETSIKVKEGVKAFSVDEGAQLGLLNLILDGSNQQAEGIIVASSADLLLQTVAVRNLANPLVLADNPTGDVQLSIVEFDSNKGEPRAETENFGALINVAGNADWHWSEVSFRNNTVDYALLVHRNAKLAIDSSAVFTSNNVRSALRMDSTSQVRLGSAYFTSHTSSDPETHQMDNGAAVIVLGSSNLTITDRLEVINNTARVGGGFFLGANSLVTVDGSSLFSHNTANEGGAVAMTGEAIFRMRGKSTWSDNSASGGGCVLLSSSPTLQLTGDATFTSNKAQVGGVLDAGNQAIIIVDGTFTAISNAATMEGGVVRLANDATLIFKRNVLVVNNSAAQGGGMHISISSSVNAFERCVFQGNTATGQSSPASTAGHGGALFMNGEATWQSSGDVLFDSNTAFVDGGGVYMAKGTSFIMSKGSLEASSNTAQENGGAWYVGGDAIVKVETTGYANFHFNVAQIGGALCAMGYRSSAMVTLAVNSVDFWGNTASQYGGAVYLSGAQLVLGSPTSSRGSSRASQLPLATISNNTAQDFNGGGVFLKEQSQMEINMPLCMQHNVARYYGGAMFLQDASVVTLGPAQPDLHGQQNVGLNTPDAIVVYPPPTPDTYGPSRVVCQGLTNQDLTTGFYLMNGSVCSCKESAVTTNGFTWCGCGDLWDDKACECGEGAIRECKPSDGPCCGAEGKFLNASHVCRPAKGQCDKEETCSGKSAQCPVDQLKPLGISCKAAGPCVSGPKGICDGSTVWCKPTEGKDDGSTCDWVQPAASEWAAAMSEHPGVPSGGQLVDAATAKTYAKAASNNYNDNHGDWPDCRASCRSGVCILERSVGCCRVVTYWGENNYGVDEKPPGRYYGHDSGGDDGPDHAYDGAPNRGHDYDGGHGKHHGKHRGKRGDDDNHGVYTELNSDSHQEWVDRKGEHYMCWDDSYAT